MMVAGGASVVKGICKSSVLFPAFQTASKPPRRGKGRGGEFVISVAKACFICIMCKRFVARLDVEGVGGPSRGGAGGWSAVLGWKFMGAVFVRGC
jgi:hypothetical protein